MNLQDNLQEFLSRHQRPVVMAIVNATPDSFSGDGVAGGGEMTEEAIVAMVQEKLRAGMDIIDIGGESTRPGAAAVSVADEIKRLTPFAKTVAKYFPSLTVSIDSQKPAVVAAMFEILPRVIVNDVAFGLDEKRDEEMLAVLSGNKEKLFGYIVMHNGTGGGIKKIEENKKLGASYSAPDYHNIVDSVKDFFARAIKKITAAGIDEKKLILDVGFGFGKSIEDSLSLLHHMADYKSFGLPLLVGVSRKSFIGKLLGQDINQRLIAGTAMETLALHSFMAKANEAGNGADAGGDGADAGGDGADAGADGADAGGDGGNDVAIMVRVHDVAAGFDMARVLAAVRYQRRPDYIIALGSNMGSNMNGDKDGDMDGRKRNITAAIEALNKIGCVVRQSPLYNSAPQYNTEQDDFVNAAVVYRGRQEPLELLSELKKIEKEFGRATDQERHQPRPIDLDIIAYGEQVLTFENLVIPHPLAFERGFVLQPLVDIQPWFIFRNLGCYARDLLSQISNPQIQKI